MCIRDSCSPSSATSFVKEPWPVTPSTARVTSPSDSNQFAFNHMQTDELQDGEDVVYIRLCVPRCYWVRSVYLNQTVALPQQWIYGIVLTLRRRSDELWAKCQEWTHWATPPPLFRKVTEMLNRSMEGVKCSNREVGLINFKTRKKLKSTKSNYNLLLLYVRKDEYVWSCLLYTSRCV